MAGIELRPETRGLVQDVGKRGAMAEEARRLGLWGRSRSRRDGSVMGAVAGPATTIDRILAWAGAARAAT